MLIGKKEYGEGRKVGSPGLDMKTLVSEYENEMIGRVGPAVQRATQACLDATHFDQMRQGSFFVSNRFEKNVK